MKKRNKADEVWNLPVRKEHWYSFAMMERFIPWVIVANKPNHPVICNYENRKKLRLKQWFKAFQWMEAAG